MTARAQTPSNPPPTLVLTARQISRLRDHLLRDDGKERMAYVYCSPSGPDRLLADELVELDDTALGTQTPTACRPDLVVERDRLTDCCRRDMHPLIVHSHPFDTSGAPWFSSRDDDLMASQQEMLTGLYPDEDLHVMFAVVGHEGLATVVYDRETDRFVDLPIDVLGHRELESPLQTPDQLPPVDPYAAPDVEIDEQRLDRGIRALGEDGQRRLAGTHVGLIGAGGLGSIMAESFARYGIGDLTVVDPDVIEASNLNRVFGASDHHVGRPKVELVKEAVWRANPTIDVTTVQDTAESVADTLKECDLLVAGVDQISCRMWLNQFAVRHLIPYVDAGVKITPADEGNDDSVGRVESMDGFIHRIVPGVTECFDCLKRSDLEAARLERLSDEELAEEVERGYVDETALSPEPAVVPLNGIVASYTVQVVARHITGYAPPADFLHVDTVGHEITRLHAKNPRDDCPTCPPDGIRGRGDRVATDGDQVTENLDLDLPVNQTSEPTGPVSAGFDWLFDTPALNDT